MSTFLACIFLMSMVFATGAVEADSYLFEPWTGPYLPGLEDYVMKGILTL